MMIGHVVRDNVVWVTDLYSRLRDKDKNEGMVAFAEALKKYDIKPLVIAGGHGGMAPSAVLEGIIGKD
jgi:hypothetical protein